MKKKGSKLLLFQILAMVSYKQQIKRKEKRKQAPLLSKVDDGVTKTTKKKKNKKKGNLTPSSTET